MENASKALLIAGAILIVIILIGIGVAVINSTGNVQDQAASSANSMEVQAFNAQFTPYLGDKVPVAQVRALISLVNSITYRKVDVYYEDGMAYEYPPEGYFSQGSTYKVFVGYNGFDNDGYINVLIVDEND